MNGMHIAHLLWLPCVADADIIFCSCGYFLLSFFFPCPFSGCLPYFHTWCGLSTNLECRSEMSCTQLTGNTRHKKSPSAHHHTSLSTYIFANKACIDNGKTAVKQQCLLHMSLQYDELQPTNGWDRFGSVGQISMGFASWLHYCSNVIHWKPTKLCTMFGRLMGSYTMYSFLGLLPPDGILPGAKFTLHQSLAFSYIGSVTARHSSNGHQPNFAAWYKEWNYGTFAEGATYIWLGSHHVRHRPTF